MYNQIAMNVANNAVASGIVGLANVKGVLPSTETQLASYTKDGIAYALADDLVTWYQTGESKVLNMDYRGLIDNVVFNTALIGITSRAGAINQAVDYVDSVSPFAQNVNNAIVDGAVITLGQTVKDYIVTNNVLMNTPVKYAVHASSLLSF